MSLAHFFWLEIAFNATRTRMAPPVAIAATGFFNLEQSPIRRVLQPRRLGRSGFRIQQDACFHGLLLSYIQGYSHRDRSTPRGLAFALQKLRNAKRRMRSSTTSSFPTP